MSVRRDKVVVAMSGGVDSSVAACLLVEEGYDVIGLFMRVGATDEATKSILENAQTLRSNPVAIADRQLPIATSGLRSHQGCCSASDAADARFVAGMLGIPFYALNFEREFDGIIDYFADEYVHGRTPNPCVMCNSRLKFGKIVEYADAVGARYIATGHYARVVPASRLVPVSNRWEHQSQTADRSPGGSEHRLQTGATRLLRARDERKDQSYVLFGLNRAILDRVLFPIGDLTKPQVREIAAHYGLPNQNKPDSVEICFVPDRDYARVVRQRRPDDFAEGDVIDEAGQVIGKHQGIGHYTIGQRRGLGIALGEPHYVTELNVAANTVTLGPADSLLAGGLIGQRANFLVDVPDGSFRALVKIRYLHTAVPATIYHHGKDAVRVVFDEPQRAVTPGQAAVFYDGDLVLGGAWIDRAD